MAPPPRTEEDTFLDQLAAFHEERGWVAIASETLASSAQVVDILPVPLSIASPKYPVDLSSSSIYTKLCFEKVVMICFQRSGCDGGSWRRNSASDTTMKRR